MSFSPLNSSGTVMSLPATNPVSINMTLVVQVVSQLDSAGSQVLRGSNSGSGVPSTSPITIKAGADLRNFS